MILGVHHTALATRNLGRMIDFYTQALGFELVSRGAWKDNPRTDRIVGHTGSAAALALLRLGDFHIEMFEYLSPPPGEAHKRLVSEPGYQHIALLVSDIDAEYERLKDIVRFNCPPIALVDGGRKATYGRDPDGNVIEFLEQVTAL